MINSRRIKFTFKFKVEPIKMKKGVKKYKRRTTAETLIFLLGPRLYDINTFNAPSTVMDSMGIGLVFMRPKDNNKGKVYLKEYHTSNELYNLQAAYNEKYFTKYICDFQYLNKDVSLNIDFNFKTGTASFYLNDKLCFDYVINRNVFVEEKLSYTFYGYSVSKDPVSIAFKDIMVRKLMEKGLKRRKDSFHSSAKSVIDVNYFLN